MKLIKTQPYYTEREAARSLHMTVDELNCLVLESNRPKHIFHNNKTMYLAIDVESMSLDAESMSLKTLA